MSNETKELLQKPTKEEISRMVFNEVVKRKKFAYQAAVANGTNAERLLSGLYKDPTHFIYELLQNAEDTGATEVKITLEDKKLVFSHNGRAFNNNDIWAILSIDESTKNEEEDVTKIGRFGIGFKAVFGICEAPEIYSNKLSFKICNFYVPENINSLPNQECDKTYIILPFKESEIQHTFSIIKEALSTLNPDTILFLQNIKKIDYSMPGYSGFFEKKKNNRECYGHKYFECDILGRQGLVAKYYLFEKKLNRNDKLISSIAYRINEGKKQIVAEENTKLVVFFPTETNTFLKFKMNGPYQTTPTRESVPETKDNIEILNETAELYANSLRCLKELKLLTVDFLSLLPLKSRKTIQHRLLGGTFQAYQKTDSIFYETLYDVTVKSFSEEKLLPTLDGKFTTADKAILARGETIVDLLTAEDNAVVFGERTTWLSTSITRDRTPELREFITSILKVTEIDFDGFLSTVTGTFLETKNNDWLIRFYIIGNSNIGTVKEKYLNKPIIKTASGKMVSVQVDKKPNVYLTSKLISDNEKIVHRDISENEEVLRFFRSIGIAEMNIVESIRTQWLPSIISSKDEKDNLDNLELLYLEYNDQKKDTQEELCELLSSSDCIMYKNDLNKNCFDKPSEFFMAHGIVKTLYNGCSKIRFINDELNAKAESDRGFYNFLKTIGVRTNLRLIEQTNMLPSDERQSLLKNATISRGSLIEKAYQIYEIKYILDNITEERSRALWQAFDNISEDKYKGTIEWRSNSKLFKEEFNAYFIKTLQEAKWLYQIGNKEPISPREIFQDEAEKEYGRSIIVKYIDFKPDAERQLPPEQREILALAKRIPIEELRKLAEACAIAERLEDVNINPEETPVIIEEVGFNNSKKGRTAEELLLDEKVDNGELTNILEELYGNADISDTIKNKIAIKLTTNEAEIDGDLGERFVLSSLKKEYRQNGYDIINEDNNSFSAIKEGKTIDIVRHNIGNKNQRGYDITIAERGIVFAYIEVKAKKDDNPKLFKVSGLQWEYAKKLYEEGNGDKHWVYIVTNVRDKYRTKITKTPNPYKAWLDGNLEADPVCIKL